MGYDDNVDVATLIGYASRKLGRYDDAKYWYDKALAADPNHALTWSYYGMWQAEQGNLLKAKDDLEKVAHDLRQHRVPRICRAQGSDRRHQDVLGRGIALSSDCINRHCEDRKATKQSRRLREPLDCFASLAMTSSLYRRAGK